MRKVTSRRRGSGSAGVEPEFGDDADDGSVEFEQAAFVEDCGYGCGGDDFGERGEVEEGGWRDVKIPSPVAQNVDDGQSTLWIA